MTFRSGIVSPKPSWVQSAYRLPATIVIFVLSFGMVASSHAADPPPIHPDGIRGALVIAGGGKLPASAKERFLKLAGGDSAKLVIVPTAATDAVLDKGDAALNSWRECGASKLTLLHTRSRDQANDPEFLVPLMEATGVWFDGGSQARIAEAYVGTKFETELNAVLERGGVVGGTSAGAAIMSRVMIAQGNPVAEIKTGFNLLPGCILDQHFTERKRKPRLIGAIEIHPELFGLGIDEGTAIVAQGRDIEVIGANQVTICLGKSGNRPAREIELPNGEKTDLTRWRRAALARTLAAFPPEQPPEPRVPHGSLLIVGGGGMTPEMIEKFIELAGGPDAPIVVLPTANPDPLPTPPRDGKFLERAGCKHVTTLSARSAKEVASPEFLAALKEAKGVWFGGGRQWRFVDAYEGTPAVAAFHDVLTRGGVIGGSSAGATIQGDFLVRGSPLGNQEMMAEGYERGFAFLPGTAIDQHFTQRKRQPDMLAVMETHPQLLGIGLDETTAIIVRDHVAEVIGKDQVHFYNTRLKTEDGKPTCISLPTGKQFDLVARQEIVLPEKTETNQE
jgi:cyanophycinase